MANDKRFVVKNGLQSQNIAFVDSDKTNTITANMLSSDTLSFEGQVGQLFSIADSMGGTIFSVNDISGIPSIEVDDDGEIRLAEFSGHVLIGTDSSTDTAKHIVQITGGLNADSITVTGDITTTDGRFYGSGSALTSLNADNIGSGTIDSARLPLGVFGGGSGLDSAGVKTVVFNDNEKLNFGTSSDLEIFHNGSNSIINENGTGDLLLQVAGTTALKVADNSIQGHPSQDLHATFGRAKVGGGFAGATNVAVFCHEDQGGHIDRTALYQDSAGKTILNARAGQHVSIRTNNFPVATFDSNSVSMYEDVVLETGATSPPSLLLRNDGNALSVISGNTLGAGVLGMGDEDDLVMLHTPGFNYIWARKQTDDIQIITTNNNGTSQIAASFEGGVTTKCALRANNGVKLETDSAGINVTGQIDITGDIIFEGATADAHETTLTVTDPTADRTITFPDNTGSVPVKLYTDITTSGNAATSLTISNSVPNASTSAQTHLRWVAHDITASSGPNSPILTVQTSGASVTWTGVYYNSTLGTKASASTTDLLTGLGSNYSIRSFTLDMYQTDTNDWVVNLVADDFNGPYFFQGHATSFVPYSITFSSGSANNITGLTGSLTEEFGVIS
jgi:hypothetical protein